MTLKDTFRERWPELTLRFFDWLLSLVIFAAIADKGGADGCWFGYKKTVTTLTVTTDKGACSFAIFMGVITWFMDFFLIFLIFLKDLVPSLANRTPKAAPLIMFILKAVWTFFWFATAMNLAIKYTVTCTTMENFGQKCSDRSGHQAELGAVFFSWVCLLFWIITSYWGYTQLQGQRPHVDDSYQQQHDEAESQTPGAPTHTGPERQQPMMGASDAPIGDTSGAVDVTHPGNDTAS